MIELIMGKKSSISGNKTKLHYYIRKNSNLYLIILLYRIIWTTFIIKIISDFSYMVAVVVQRWWKWIYSIGYMFLIYQKFGFEYIIWMLSFVSI